jgi:hypothetical protein
MRWRFWESEKRVEEIPAITNKDIAIGFLDTLKNRSQKSREEIAYVIVNHVFEDKRHIHSNPKARKAA